MRLEYILLTLLTVAFVTSCGGDDTSVTAPGDGGACVGNVCGPRCSPSIPCASGHACVPINADLSVCSRTCDSSLCSGPSVCDSPLGACTMRQCGAAAPCADTSKFCDLARGICLPLSGACESVADCPALPSELATYTVGCNAKRVCEVTQALTPFPFGAESTLQFVTPTPGQGYADQGAFQLVWDQMVAPTFVEIFAHELTSESNYAAELLWVASWRPGQPGPRWGDGFHVENDEWKKPPNDLPTGVPLFAVALALDGATLKGATPFTPFYIGKSPWPSAGSACGAAADCLNPAAAATCVSGACQLLCMSDVTCPLGHLCTASQVVRTCAP